ncbi:unnamed protein product, partial [Timema podura]|nr:unnamed protein product [Timema podura]
INGSQTFCIAEHFSGKKFVTEHYRCPDAKGTESSMFITQHRFILKTCGTTTPLQCLQPLLLLVEQYAGFDDVKEVFYSRKNFKRPELQMNPYQAFEQEVSLLNTYFQGKVA